MKRLAVHSGLLTLCLICCCTMAQAQETTVCQEAARYLQLEDVRSLSALFAPQLEVSINKQSGLYDAAVTEQMLKNFFDTHETQHCQVSHAGARGESCFCICSLTTDKQQHRVYILFKQDRGTYRIHQFRIDHGN